MVDIWAHFGDFGALCVGFVLFGGFGWPLGAYRLDQGPLAHCTRVRAGTAKLRVTRFWGPKALCREPKVDGQGPNAIGHGLSAKHTKT